MDIRSLMLVSGKEVIADLESVSELGYHTKNPLLIHMMQGQDGVPTIAFGQYSMIQKLDDEVIFPASALESLPVRVLEPVADSFIKNTSSILLPPTEAKKILLG